MRGKMFWTDEKEKLLEKYLLEGNSYGVVGQMIGCSRNAAIGKAKRLGIVIKTVATKTVAGPVQRRHVKRPTGQGIPRAPFQKVIKPRPKPKPKPMRFRVRLPEELRSDEGFAHYMKLPKEMKVNRIIDIPSDFACHWITGDVKAGSGVWCRQPVLQGTKWCPAHNKLVYVPGTAFSSRSLKRKL